MSSSVFHLRAYSTIVYCLRDKGRSCRLCSTTTVFCRLPGIPPFGCGFVKDNPLGILFTVNQIPWGLTLQRSSRASSRNVLLHNSLSDMNNYHHYTNYRSKGLMGSNRNHHLIGLFSFYIKKWYGIHTGKKCKP